MSDYSCYNDVYAPYDAMSIPLYDRAIFFGEAVYDVMIGGHNKVYQFTEHMKRLRENAEKLNLIISYSNDDIMDKCIKIIQLSNYDFYTLYIQVSGYSKRRAHLNKNRKSNLLITVSGLHLTEKYECISALLLPDRRYDYCDIKTTNLLPAVMSISLADHNSADIAIFHTDDLITECSHANISILKDGNLITAPYSTKILPGITKNNLLASARDAGINLIEQNIKVNDLYNSDAVLITSTTHFLRVCNRIGNTTLQFDENTVSRIFNMMISDFFNQLR